MLPFGFLFYYNTKSQGLQDEKLGKEMGFVWDLPPAVGNPKCSTVGETGSENPPLFFYNCQLCQFVLYCTYRIESEEWV